MPDIKSLPPVEFYTLTKADIDAVFLRLLLVELTQLQHPFVSPKNVLSTLPPNEMTLNEMELELELLKEVIGIFKGKGPDYAPNSMQEIVDMYTARQQALEHEILERSLLQYS